MKDNEKELRRLREERRAKASCQEFLENPSDLVIWNDSFTVFLKDVRSIRKTEHIPLLRAQRPPAGSTQRGSSHHRARTVTTSESSPTRNQGFHSGKESGRLPTRTHTNATEITTSSRYSENNTAEKESINLHENDHISSLGQHAQLKVGSAEVQALCLSPPNPPGSESLPGPKPVTIHSQKGSSESGSMKVRPSAKILKGISSAEPRAIQGCLRALNGAWISEVGILEPGQSFNFITTGLVAKLGLLSQVDQYTGEDYEVKVESLGGRTIIPDGTVQIQWQYTGCSRPISLVFWVFSYHRETPLVFGEPFVCKSRRYLKIDWT